MIRALFALPVIAIVYTFVFVAYVSTFVKLMLNGGMFKIGMVNTVFGCFCNAFWLDLNDWVSKKKFGDRTDKLMDEFE